MHVLEMTLESTILSRVFRHRVQESRTCPENTTPGAQLWGHNVVSLLCLSGALHIPSAALPGLWTPCVLDIFCIFSASPLHIQVSACCLLTGHGRNALPSLLLLVP